MEYPGWQRLTVKGEERSTPVIPWEWTTSTDIVEKIRSVTKAKRKETIDRCGWNIYSIARGEITDCVVTKENQANSIGGIVLDYDAKYNEEYLAGQIENLSKRLRPQFVEVSLSGNLRLFWKFDRFYPVVNTAHAKEILEQFGRLVKADKLHPGFDRSSYNPCQRWTNGYEWRAVAGDETLSEKTIASILHSAAKKLETKKSSVVNLQLIAEEVEKRWPGKWQGEFKIGSKGVRFWDDSADNSNGVYVKEEGVVCVTGEKAWVSWDEIFGQDWVQKHKEDVVGEAVNNIHFDGQKYWRVQNGIWREADRQDTILHLQNRGFSNRTGKGETVSAAGRILNQIQELRRVDFAVPMVNRKPGIVKHEGALILNTVRLEHFKPAESGGFEDCKFIMNFISNLFVDGVRALPFFLAWLQRSYVAFNDGKTRLGQSIFICGPRNNGKTLLNVKIVKPLLGGKSANPHQFLTGETSFNSDLYECYYWSLDDAESPKEGAKSGMLSKIKGLVVNREHQYHKKFGAKMVMPWNGRFLCTHNDDPASIAMLPERNENTTDKLMFFRTQEIKGPWATEDELDEIFEKELPYFARGLINYCPPPGVLDNSRVGVKSYFDPKVLEMSCQQQPQYNFHEILQTWLTESDKEEFLGTVADLLGDMTNSPSVGKLATDYKPYFAHKHLTALTRSPGSGVTKIDGNKRIFKITKV